MPSFRKIGAIAGIVLVVLILAFASGGWYLSNIIRDDGLIPDREEPMLDLEVVAVGEGLITLRATDETEENGDWQHDGLFGLVTENGYYQVGAIVDESEGQVVRELIASSSDIKVGDMVRVDSYTFPSDPQQAYGIPFEIVSFTSGLGEFPAWQVSGDSNTWVIIVHGRNGDRGEALRILPTIVDMGLNVLVISYRNDAEVPADITGFHRYGLTEWQEVDGAARYAIQKGAEDLVLVGYSMGGGIVANFLYESSLADEVEGVILDAPMLDFGGTLDFQGRERGYPHFALDYAKAFAAFRFDVDWDATNYLRRVDELDVPVLLFHGDADDTVPVYTSDALAQARPDIVTYVRYEDVGHVRAWNKDRDGYEKAVNSFLKQILD